MSIDSKHKESRPQLNSSYSKETFTCNNIISKFKGHIQVYWDWNLKLITDLITEHYYIGQVSYMRSGLQYFQSTLNPGSTYMDPSECDEIAGVLVHKQVLLVLSHAGVCGPRLLGNQHVCDVKTVMYLHTQIALIYYNIFTHWNSFQELHSWHTLWTDSE